ncbi:11422_t:CDS:10 [Rhizophagus irregularis]|nr:11422_t:CDS:10 [Rhizophagus irregularis]
MTNTNGPNAPKGAIGREFRPREPFTHRLRKILEEYPDGSQILREILQNSDDAKSTEQVFILDHNTYPSNRLIKPDLVNYERANLKLGRYQGPALLAKNNTIFDERDFKSLLKLADSEKQDQFDKIGVMGVGFNSIYHITDSPSFITGDKYVILDPHEWYFRGGIEFDHVKDRLAEHYPDQFAPFRIPCNKNFEGTIFRYPLRDSDESEISKKIYTTDEIKEMFRKFYENESINCLLFLKYIECISFYELEKGAIEPKLLYKIQLMNAEKVRQERRLIVEKIMPMMDSLNSGKLDENQQLETTYVASFSRQKGDSIESNSKWLILNYLDDLRKTDAYFQSKFKKNIGEYKFVPNVGLAIPLENLNATGRLFCFLPLPIEMPFLVSVHGYFAVSNNRRSLWSPADGEDLAFDALANLKIEWNKYLFEKVLPKAWVKLLHELPIKIPNIGSYDRLLADINLLKIIGNIGFPVISVPYDVIRVLKESKHRNSLRVLSPAIIRTYLNSNRNRWEFDAISRKEVLQLFKFILGDKKFDELEGFKMIPLANNTFDTLTLSSKSYMYIDKITENIKNYNNSLINQLNSNKLIDKNIDSELYKILYDNAKVRWNGCDLNIKILDEIEVKDLISIISDIGEDKELSMDEIKNVIEILKRIAKIQHVTKIEENDQEILDELLIPSTKNRLLKIREIYSDDLGNMLDNEERSEYNIVHSLVTQNIASELGIQTLRGRIFGNENEEWEIYGQHESLTTRIKNILNDYSMDSLFKEFLQNADDAGAKKFSVYLDERPKFQHNPSKKSLFSEELEVWQGHAIWIYNDAEFNDTDFTSLLKLGIGGKSDDDTKIGRFGIGFNCAFHVTDLPSLVSREYIAFLDPHAKFLPEYGYPSKKRKGVKINFMKTDFGSKFPDQCYPYMAIEGCDFTKEFKRTLFRLPLRTRALAEDSKISQGEIKINNIRKKFSNIQSNKEMLFLRNIESCSFYNIEGGETQLIWKSQIRNIKSCREDRQNIVDNIVDAPIYQLNIERKDYKNNELRTKNSEIWLLCTGGHDFDKDLMERKTPNPPKLEGEVFSYLSLSISTNLGVHLNGNFSLTSARRGIFQSKSDLPRKDSDKNVKQNLYILYDVLPDLHVKLLDYVVKKHENKEANFLPYIMNNLWPNTKDVTMNFFKNYGLNVIKKLGNDIHRIFWTEADDGQFISLKDARIFRNEEKIIVDILVSSGISAVMLEEDKIKQLNEIIESGESEFPYKPVSGESICEDLQLKISSIPSFKREDMIVDKYTHDDLFKLLEFILQDKNSYEILSGLPLVPLSNGLVGKFGEVYYVGHEFLDLFPDIGPSKFVSADLLANLSIIFKDDYFSKKANIKMFNASAVLDLLGSVLKPVRELNWNPNGKSLPDRRWFERIWLIFNNDARNIDFDKLSKFPILSTIKPSNMLVRPDISNPLIQNGNSLFSLFDILVKLKVRFTDMTFPESAHEDLKKCVNECTAINIINSLERACLPSTMERLFEKLSSSECEKFRTFIKDELKTLIAHEQSQRGFMKILRSLPIWPIHSSENKFIDATTGDLPPRKLPFFSFHKKTNFYRCDHESDFNALTKLGVTPMDTLEYLKGIVKQVVDESDHSDEDEFEPSQAYVIFLQRVLLLRDREIEKYLGPKEIIPNKPLSDFAHVDTLYDMSVPVLRSIFHDTDKYFLPPELQNNPVCLEALKRMGLISTAKGIPLPERNNLFQKDALLTSLLDKLTVEPDDDYHDATFIVGEERKIIRANRYVLSAASKKFEEKFRDNINEIEIEFHQDVFKVFLQLLYGQTFKDATIPILSTASDFKTEHEFKTHYLSFLIDLLKLTVSYEVKPLRNKVEDAIMEGEYVNIRDLYKIIECLKDFDVEQRLKGFFEEHIRSYRNPINKQLRKNAVTVKEKSEISKISQKLQPYLQNK